jgi:hypothetical protein
MRLEFLGISWNFLPAAKPLGTGALSGAAIRLNSQDAISIVLESRYFNPGSPSNRVLVNVGQRNSDRQRALRVRFFPG